MLANSQGRGLIIWPIAQRLFQSVMMQSRPRWTGGRMIPVGSTRHAGTRPDLPWDERHRPPSINFGRFDRPPLAFQTVNKNFALCALGIPTVPLSNIVLPWASKSPSPGVVHGLKPMPNEVFKIIGVSKDNLGADLGFCTMNLFRVDIDSGNNRIYTHMGNTVSDVNGNYSFTVNRLSTYRVTGENGSVVGMTVNTLTGLLV
jgi:hypothetical protein